MQVKGADCKSDCVDVTRNPAHCTRSELHGAALDLSFSLDFRTGCKYSRRREAERFVSLRRGGLDSFIIVIANLCGYAD